MQEYKRQADWACFTATPPLEALRSLLIFATIEELPNEVVQQVAWTETVVMMLIDVRRHTFTVFPGEECMWNSQQKPAQTKAKLDDCSEACMAAETLE